MNKFMLYEDPLYDTDGVMIDEDADFEDTPQDELDGEFA